MRFLKHILNFYRMAKIMIVVTVSKTNWKMLRVNDGLVGKHNRCVLEAVDVYQMLFLTF